MLIELRPPHPAGMDHARAEWAGRVYTAAGRNGIVPAMARELVAAGCPDGPWRAARDGLVVMTGPSLAGVAELTVSDPDDGGGPRFSKFKPYRQPAERAAALQNERKNDDSD
jgi:hypothetical protein